MLLNGSVTEHNGKNIKIIKHIGKGKGGDSYLAEYDGGYVVFKQMHYEPCEVYTFEVNKLHAELRDYKTLNELDIAMPALLFYNDEKQYLVKKYINGPTIAEIVAQGKLKDGYVSQMFSMCEALYANGLNIDYFPTNFVVENERLYYIDYECNPYMDEWDFEHWGIYFWVNSDGMKKFLNTGDYGYIIADGKPIKDGLQETVLKYKRERKF